ncbi:hypothetical protein BN7_6201 [Wickerhamomyces ciferrii]|uniref:Uncharacterized protein n=1 Tax=Wickerhamomyces ciferrii (strain ATCC 14091 / BCRC 22168 / CBS 111 / JCM 3599 / NBRC 0793 / NRRL Y-1031 F-60-10) TaxID=1206466 RepID=K0KX32_WICCF|nr:uncharacterized protein BN7_6201 [Wickerhamomyces ciferrii]CCH46607.1 hypothetical protein BN7_6201 [Wickerhamomyces ciferrii]
MSQDTLVPIEHHGPSIAVKFWDDDLLFVGHGPILKIYNYKTSEIVKTIRIFKKNKIHGIAFDRDTFLFYGARSFNMLSFDQIMEQQNIVDNEQMINDWIITAEFSANGLEAFILTAHNVILSIDSYSQTLQWEKSVYGEKSILYSGSIRVVSKQDVYINAGTVMGGVVIWNLYKEEIVHTLLGHEGSIFNVQMSPSAKYIVSCSDDRSIKLWDHKTGDLLSTAWGHTARIWNLKFYDDEKSVISVSEDLTSRTWNITENQELLPYETYQLHSGRHIWGLDVSDKVKLAATGGNDGRIRLFSVKTGETESYRKTFTLEDITNSAPDYIIKKNEIVKGFWKLKFGLVIITSEGGIFIYKDQKWELLRIENKFNNFSLTNGFTDDNIIIFTNTKGDSLFLKFDEEGKIINEKWINTEVTKIVNALSTKDGSNFYLMIESPNKNEKLVVYEFDQNFEISRTVFLEKGPTFVTTCFEVNGDFIFAGFRLSSLGIYSLSTGEETKFIKKLSISDTVTSIKSIKSDDKKTLLIISNRDGYYVYIKFDKATSECEFIHSNNTRRGFLEGSYNINDELILFGFKSSFFYIYNESRDYEIAYENCGGAHRQWKLFYSNESYEFVYTRSGSLTIREIPKAKFDYYLSEGTHGREIRDISIRNDSSKIDDLLYITGAEDTTLKLSSLNSTNGQIKNHWTLRKHTSGLQKVKFLRNDLIASSSAREEFFIWKIDESFNTPFIIPYASLNPSSDNPDLRIMDFDHLEVYDESGKLQGLFLVNVYSDSSIKGWYFDPETGNFTQLINGFYKTCCLFDVKLNIVDNNVYLLTGATDGYLTLWDITNEFSLKVQNNKLQMVTELKSNKISSPISTICVHQNGIKSFETQLNNNEILVATGGDDNALAITSFKINNSGVEAKIYSKIEDAASSTITSLNILPNDRVLVASVDQIFRIWSFKTGELKLIDSKSTTIADTGSLDSISLEGKDIALVGGVGLSAWEIKN